MLLLYFPNSRQKKKKNHENPHSIYISESVNKTPEDSKNSCQFSPKLTEYQTTEREGCAVDQIMTIMMMNLVKGFNCSSSKIATLKYFLIISFKISFQNTSRFRGLGKVC